MLAEVYAAMEQLPPQVAPVAGVAAHVRTLCRTFDVACPTAAELGALLQAEPGDDDPTATVVDELVAFVATDEFLVPLPPEDPTLARRLAEAVAALGETPEPGQLAAVAADVMALEEGDRTIDDVVFSLETPLDEIWTLARTAMATTALFERAGIAKPEGARGDRFARLVAGTMSELDRPVAAAGPAIEYQVSGLPVLYRGLERSVNHNQWRSLGFALLLVVILLSVVFRSLFTGLLATTPTALTLLLVYGAMGALDVSLDIGTSMLASLIIGAGVDYAVHMVAGWRAPEGRPASEGAQPAARTTAVAIWTNATMVAAGFYMLTLGQARPLQNVGMLTASAMIIAAMTTFVAIPVLARKRSYSKASVLDAMDSSAPSTADASSE